MATWDALRVELIARLGSKTHGETWIGITTGNQALTISIADANVEIVTLVCPADQMNAVVALQLGAKAPAGAIVLEKGSAGERYVLRQLVPLEIATAPAIEAMVTSMERWMVSVVNRNVMRANAASVFGAFAD